MRYPRGTPALTVREDGSAVLRWPAGGIAVSCEPEPGTPIGFRLCANYRRGGRMAASFDGGGGGFAYRPDGSLLLRLEPGGRGGALVDADGRTTEAWQGARAGSRLCLPLDEFLALVLEPNASPPHAGLSAAFKCDGLALEVLHGPNPQQASWRDALDAEEGLAGLGTSHVARRGRANTDWAGAVPPAGAGPRAGLHGGIADAMALLPNLSKPRLGRPS